MLEFTGQLVSLLVYLDVLHLLYWSCSHLRSLPGVLSLYIGFCISPSTWHDRNGGTPQIWQQSPWKAASCHAYVRRFLSTKCILASMLQSLITSNFMWETSFSPGAKDSITYRRWPHRDVIYSRPRKGSYSRSRSGCLVFVDIHKKY